MKEYKKVFEILKNYFSYGKELMSYWYLGLGTQTIGVLLASIFSPLVLKYIVDNVSLNDIDAVWFWFFVYVGIVVLYRISFYCVERLLIKFENGTQLKIAERTFSIILEKDYEFYANEQSGGLISKFDRYVSSFENICDSIIYNILGALIALTGMVIVLFFESVILAFLFATFFIVFLVSFSILNKKKLQLSEATSSKKSIFTAQLADSVTNIFTVMSFGQSGRESSSFKRVNKSLRSSVSNEWTYNANMWAFLYSGLSVLTLITYATTIYLWSISEVTIGTFILVSGYLTGVFFRLGDLGYAVSNVTTKLTEAIEMSDILKSSVKVINKNEVAIKVLEGRIAFSNIVFNYTGDGADEIDGLDLEIKSGESVGLVGHSGAGKSTIVKLLLRFIDPISGRVLIDNQDIKQVTQESLRKSIGYVPQEPLLFHRTLRENIAYGKPDATWDEVIAAAKLANAHDFIESLPEQYDTLVGERGVKLSGGQRQRVAIARAILKDAPILILDEATSSLDSKSEREIQSAIDNLIKGKTVIAIAHRLSTIKHLDRIIVLENGRIAEQGTHEELLQGDGIYADLWNHQQGGFIE